jgi:hypothetical protein
MKLSAKQVKFLLCSGLSFCVLSVGLYSLQGTYSSGNSITLNTARKLLTVNLPEGVVKDKIMNTEGTIRIVEGCPYTDFSGFLYINTENNSFIDCTWPGCVKRGVFRRRPIYGWYIDQDSISADCSSAKAVTVSRPLP